ncbi:MAG: helix-turn-helix domain-containing protein [Chloroflexota bacterium]|nr:helix-turn-helix domain-containing protein [Chloroflexota bacterium]
MRKRQTKSTATAMPPIVQLLSIPEVAQRLGIGRTKVYDLIKTESLPFVQLGDAKRVSVVSLQRWIEQREQAS